MKLSMYMKSGNVIRFRAKTIKIKYNQERITYVSLTPFWWQRYWRKDVLWITSLQLSQIEAIVYGWR